MKFSTLACTSLYGCSVFAQTTTLSPTTPLTVVDQTSTISDAAASTPALLSVAQGKLGAILKPKVMLVNMFILEQEAWITNLNLTNNVTIPMVSPEYPDIHCNANYEICQITTGEGEINAASTMAGLSMSPLFDLTETYFLVSGIAGGSPDVVTLGDVTFAKYAVQVGLQYQIDSREMPANWSYGYVNFGTKSPNQYPINIYGSEVFEVNEVLRNRAMYLASNITLNNGTEANAEFRSKYGAELPAARNPKIVACDTATSDVYWTGQDLAHAFEDYVRTVSNGTATYCSTQQEDNATLESLMRAAKHGLVDYNRIVVTRSISDFDRAPPGLDPTEFFFNISQGGIGDSLVNLYLAGNPFVQDVITNWDTMYKQNVFTPTNYIGDIFGTLGGKEIMDFGPDHIGTA